MAWLLTDKRGPEWKQDWVSRCLSSISLPPPSLLAIFAITVLLFSVSKYMEYKAEIHKTENNFNLILFLLPVILLLIVRSMCIDGRFALWLPIPVPDTTIQQAGNSPWGVAALVVFLLVMVSYQSSFQSHWFRPLWK